MEQPLPAPSGFGFNLMGQGIQQQRNVLNTDRSSSIEYQEEQEVPQRPFMALVNNQLDSNEQQSQGPEVLNEVDNSDNGNLAALNDIDDHDEDIEDMEYIEDIDGIMQFQHKILRKYAMLGMIKYTAVPYFHQLVTNRDYKMICIFEVFALNRSEDDFLENLGIYCN
jgi:hypothetical protein